MNLAIPFRSFIEAWNLLLDIPLPESWRKKYARTAPDPQLTLFAIPVVGLAAALILLIPGVFFRQIFPQNGAALLFALVATILLDAKDSGRGVSLLLAIVSMIAGKIPILPSLPQLRPPRLSALAGVIPTAGLVLLEMFKLGMCFLIFRNGAESYFVVVLVMSFTVQGVLMTLNDLDTHEQFLKIVPPLHNQVWFAAIFIALFVSIGFPLPVLVAVGATLLFALVVRNLADKLYGGVTADIITLAGAAIELTLLFAGGLLLA